MQIDVGIKGSDVAVTPRIRRRMTASEFEAVRPLVNISEDRFAAARAALVEGKTFKSIGQIYQWTPQSVNDAVGIVWAALERYQESQRVTANAGTLLPPGWEQVTLIAPSHLVAKWRAEIAKEALQSTRSSDDKSTS